MTKKELSPRVLALTVSDLEDVIVMMVTKGWIGLTATVLPGEDIPESAKFKLTVRNKVLRMELEVTRDVSKT